jgi:predicted transcriptional regulator
MQTDIMDRIAEFRVLAPVNIEGAIRSLGIDLRKNCTDLEAGISGQIRRLPDGRFEISTPRTEHYFRQRFTMAHELGHYILHRDLIGDGLDDDQMYRSTQHGRFYNTAIKLVHESQANAFAANFLMPEDLVRRVVESEGRDMKQLMARFQVSPSAMNWRLKSLSLPEV